MMVTGYTAFPAMSATVDAAYAVFGVDATYTGCDGATTPVKTLITESVTTWGDEISISNESVGIEMRRSEVAEKPRRGDTITVGSTTYRIEQVLRSATDLEWRALAVANGC